jgi:predicted RNA-binding protein YlqC (UPF0109 family)
LLSTIECRQLCKQGHLNEAKHVFQSMEEIMNDTYVFPAHVEQCSNEQQTFYDELQRSIQQVRSEISQTHVNLWNDAVNRQHVNQLHLTAKYFDRLFQSTFDDKKGETTLIDKQMQLLASYCLETFIRRLIDKPMRLFIDEDDDNARVIIRIEHDDKRNECHRIERFGRILNELEELFQTLHKHLLSRTIKIQTIKKKT